MRQLLVALTTALRKAQSSATIQSVKDDVLARLVLVVFHTADQMLLKPSLQALAQFVAKDILSLDALVEQYTAVRKIQGNETAAGVVSTSADTRNLLEALFDIVQKGDLGSTIAQLVGTILDKLDSQAIQPPSPPTEFDGRAMDRPIWGLPLLNSMSSISGDLNSFRIYVFPVLFKRNLADYSAFLEYLGLDITPDHNPAIRNIDSDYDPILYAALQSGKEAGLIEEVDGFPDTSQADRVIYLPVSWINRLLSRSSNDARLAGLSLLITSHAMTRPLPRASFASLRRYLSSLHADIDANFRGELFGLTQRLFDRLRAATATLARAVHTQSRNAKSTSKSGNEAPLDTAQRTLKRHKDFITWYLTFLKLEFRPTASYQRHISALRCLSITARSGLDEGVPKESLSKSALGETKWPFHVNVMDRDFLHLLQELIVDPFDDVRQASAILLTISDRRPSEGQASSRNGDLLRTLSRAEKSMLASGRADQADGVAHLHKAIYEQASKTVDNDPAWWDSRYRVVHHLVDTIEEMMGIAKTNHALAISKYPLHGLFASLNYIFGTGTFYAYVLSSSDLASWQALHVRTVQCIRDVWIVVHDVLCNDAPEGHMPDDMADESEVSTKDALSYSWRALKESR